MSSELAKKRKCDSPITDQNDKIAHVSDDIATIECEKKLPEDVLKRIEGELGKVVIAGNIVWDVVGRKPKSVARNELTVFHRLDDKEYRGVVSSCSSAHSLLIDAEYKVYSFGRNKYGQLGHPKLETHNEPTKIKALRNVNIIQAACGRNHSLFHRHRHRVCLWGFQEWSIGNWQQKPKKGSQYNGAPIVKVGCGADFSVILDIDGNLHTFGSPEYGQLGHNPDGKFFITRTKLAYDQVWTPQCIILYIEKPKQEHSIPITDVRIVDFACGRNHTVAIDSEKRAFSFGFGGYGRLGHNGVADEWIPRLTKYLNIAVTGGAVSAYCGSTFSIVIGGHGNPFFFGKNSAENNVIAWGTYPTYGELSIGDSPKSSSQPTFVENLNGTKVSQITMGIEHTLMILNTDDAKTNEKYFELLQFSMN